MIGLIEVKKLISVQLKAGCGPRWLGVNFARTKEKGGVRWIFSFGLGE
jgi:hypothetical protein